MVQIGGQKMGVVKYCLLSFCRHAVSIDFWSNLKKYKMESCCMLFQYEFDIIRLIRARYYSRFVGFVRIYTAPRREFDFWGRGTPFCSVYLDDFPFPCSAYIFRWFGRDTCMILGSIREAFLEQDCEQIQYGHWHRKRCHRWHPSAICNFQARCQEGGTWEVKPPPWRSEHWYLLESPKVRKEKKRKDLHARLEDRRIPINW